MEAPIKKQTLRSVREVLSDEVFKNPNFRGIYYFVQSMFVYILSLVILQQVESIYLLLPAWLFAGVAISGLFVIGHDCAHGALFRSERLNYWVGFLSMIPSLHAYNQWAYGHNRVHHGHTIKREADFVWHPVSVDTYNSYAWSKKLQHKLYWSFLGAGPYYLYEIWLKGMVLYSAPKKEAKRDQIILAMIFLLLGAGLFYFGSTSQGSFTISGGAWYFFKMFVVPFIVWNYFIGFTVYIHHIHKDIPWKVSKDWTPYYGQMQGTINYHVNPIYNFFIHNIYIHSPHHVHMKIPFYNLNKALEEIKSVYGDEVKESKSIVKEYFASTLQCKLIDAKNGQWLTYKQAKLSYPTSNLQFATGGK
ncbi:MAG: fatty acid desaturase [Spirochaetota bacterium]